MRQGDYSHYSDEDLSGLFSDDHAASEGKIQNSNSGQHDSETELSSPPRKG